jgi:hypothetical protein
VATSLGGWTCFIALAIYAYDVGGAALVGVAALVRMAPAAVAAPAMSLLGDRHSRRNVLLVLSLARAGVLAGCRFSFMIRSAGFTSRAASVTMPTMTAVPRSVVAIGWLRHDGNSWVTTLSPPMQSNA